MRIVPLEVLIQLLLNPVAQHSAAPAPLITVVIGWMTVLKKQVEKRLP